MRNLLLIVGTLLLLGTAMFGQVGNSGIKSKLDSDLDRMRGNRIPVEEQKLETGRNLDISRVHQQTVEMNQLIQSINVDVSNLQKGVMSADLHKKLKRLEKLAKDLRQAVE